MPKRAPDSADEYVSANAESTAVPTRERILDAAEGLFASQGYAATTINQVSTAVGIQGPAIYKHFQGKRDLFEEVLARLFAPFRELLGADADGDVDLPAMVRQHIANPNASRIVQHATLSGGEDLALLVEHWYVPFFAGARAATDDDGGISPVAIMAFHSMLLGYLTLAPLHQAIFDTDPLHESNIDDLLALQNRLVGFLRS